MPRPAKGARLWLRADRADDKTRRAAVWLIRDGDHTESTGCSAADYRGAQTALARYITAKYQPERTAERNAASVPIADAINIYLTDIGEKHARPLETLARGERLLSFFGDKMLSAINGALCRQYVAQRGSQSAARRELEDLRAAIVHHRREGLCTEIVEVTLPDKSLPRERWLTRDEAAALLWAAWRMRQKDANTDGETKRRTMRHLARFILVGLYTGTRAGAICGASVTTVSGRGYVDLDRGIFYRRPARTRRTKKQQTPVRLPPRLLVHMRRWKRLGLCENAVIEWGGKPVKRVSKAFAKAAAEARLLDVSPHTLRHTAATWLMQRGVPIFEAAGFLGMTVETLETTYGHHHPDFQAAAVNAMGSRIAGVSVAETVAQRVPRFSSL